jgi:hypothetical protein
MFDGEDIAVRRLLACATRRDLRLARHLGGGIHGVVYEAESNAFPGFVAVKAHRDSTPFQRERDVYLRLREERVTRIRGFNIPQVVAWDDELLVIEMTMVKQPFVLDFGGAWLDVAQEFSEDAWNQWQRQLDEVFEERAIEVRRVLAVLRSYGVILIVVHHLS